MVDFTSLLEQAAAPIAPATGVDGSPVLSNNPFVQQVTKQDEVRQATAEKKAELKAASPTAAIPDFYQIAAGLGTDKGILSADSYEKDLRTLSPMDVYLKYGSQATTGLGAGGTDLLRDELEAAGQTGEEALYDTTSGLAAGAVGSLGGLAALGTGLVNDEAGAWLGGKVQDGMQWVEGTQSDSLNAARKIQRTVSALDMRDNAFQRDQEIADGESEIVADLRRWGRDTVDTIGNSFSDPTMLIQGTAEATGSLLAGAPIAKGLRAIGAPIAARIRGLGPVTKGADRLLRFGDEAVWPAAIAGLESGGAYSQTSADILGMSFEQLEENSPTYRELVSAGATPEEARIKVANKSALMAAAIQAPIAAAAGTLTRFAETPTKVSSIGSGLANVFLKEPLEEAIQSTTAGLAQNVATRKYADESRDLSQGVGEQTGQGAVFGMTSAGVVQGPGIAGQAGKAALGATARGAIEGSKRVYRGAKDAVQPLIDKGLPLFNALVERGAERIRQMEKASPVADEAIQERAAVNVATAPVDMPTINDAIQNADATPEEKTQSQEYVSTLARAMQYDPTSEELSVLPDEQKALLEGSTSRPEAIQRMAREVAKLDGPEQLKAASSLFLLMEPFYSLQESDPATVNAVASSNPQINQILQQYEAVVADIENTPSVQRALRAINEAVSKDQVQKNIQPVSEESLGTVEGQQNVRNALAVASLHPDRGNLEANEQILTHAANGTLNLSPVQLGTLRASVELLRARKKMEAEIAAKGLQSAKDVVSSQVVAGNDPLRKIALSALQHTQGVLSAMRGSNTELATGRLMDFGKFVQHMQNKVTALNKHFADGTNRKEEAVKYEALQPNEERDFKTSRDGMWVNARSPKSIDQAQSIALEAQILADVYNGLTKTFPDLTQGEIQAVSLAPELQGNPDELAQKFRNPTPTQETTDGQQTNTQEVQSSGTTEGKAERVDSGTEAESEEGRTRAELNDRRQDLETREVVESLPPDERDAEIQRLRQEVKTANERADLDSRTGIKGPSAFDRDVKNAGAVASIDLTLFKGYNTLLTDQGGDAVLAAFGQAMKFVGEDKAYRRGGDEFAFLTDTVEEAQELIGSLQNAVENISLTLEANDQTYVVNGVPFAAGAGTNEQKAIQARDASKTKYDRNALPENIQAQDNRGSAEAGSESEDSGSEVSTEAVISEPTEEITDEPQTHPKPLALNVERIADDSTRYAFSFGGKEVGYVDISEEGQVQASKVEKPYRGMGVGKSMYLAVIEKLAAVGKTLSSDGSVTEEAARVWQALGRTHKIIKNPTAFLHSAGNWLTEDGEPVFTMETQEQEVEEIVLEETPAPEGIAAVYPNLYTGVRNFFLESFDLPEKPKTNIIGEESPLMSVRRALSSNLRLQSFVFGSSRNTLTQEAANAYQTLLSGETEGNTLGHLLSNVQDNLQNFLKTKGKNFGQTGVEANRWRNGKVLNLVEETDAGFDYNQQLLETAGLAAVQWLLSANQYESNMDEQDVSEITGIPFYELTPEIIERVTQGMSMEQAVHSLGQKISNYWGLSAKTDAYTAYTQGIPQAMASEMIRGLRDMGLLNIETTEIKKENFSVTEERTIQRYIPARLEENDPIRTFQDAIETAVMVTPEHTNYFGEEQPEVAQRQMNNPDVENTPAQKSALEKEQQTPFYINRPMVGFFTSMGRDNLLSLFGTTITDPEEWNLNHVISLEGQNQSITAAYNHMLDVAYDLTNFAGTAKQNIDEVPVRYGYNMSRVGRMQMLGKYNPQASKLVREAFLPTRVTVDLSTQNGEIWDAYTLGIAQAMGIKVHNQAVEMSQKQLDAMLNGSLAPVVQLMQTWLDNTDLNDPLSGEVTFTSEEVDQIRAGFKSAGADLTMASLHAVVDYARLQNTKDKSKFTTSVYLEADGVTNGPINAMALMTIGSFTQEWIDNIRKGGLTIGDAQSMADIRKEDAKDLYQASTDATRENLSVLREKLSQQKNSEEALEQMDQLLSLMDLFSSDVTFDPDRAWEDGALEMKRGIAKNPLTITVYGSGAAGIAGKLVGQLTTEIYARMSAVIKARNDNPNITLSEAMFPNDPDAQGKMDRFQAAYNALTRKKPSWSKGQLIFETVGQRRTTFNPRSFTFEQSELEAMNSNMLQLFVQPMRQGIEDTVGSPLMKAVGLLRDAAQLQSVILENQFAQAIDEALVEKEAKDLNWKKGDFLTEQDMRAINKKLRTIAPLVQTGDQTFMVASNQRLEVRGNDLEISAALDDTMRAGPTMYAPGQAGVRAIPMMTIGMGDGMMMQMLAQAGLEGTLKIFDGMNMPLDKIKDYSLQANEAVYESWQGNPLREMFNTYKNFLTNLKPEMVNDDTWEALSKVLYDPQERPTKDNVDYTEVYERMQDFVANLEWSAKSIDARHEALASMPVSVDQMAAAAAPFQNGRPALENLTPEQTLTELNNRYNASLQRKPVETAQVTVAPVVHVAPAKPTPEVEKVGRVHSTGARVLSWTALTKLGRTALSEPQKVIFDEIRRSLSAKAYNVVSGSVEQLDAYIEEKGLDPRPNQEVFGWTNIGDKTIFMVNPTMETMVHELVHAASYETVLAFYNREDLGENVKEITAAIARLETMMEEFLEMDDPSPAYQSAREAILSANLEPDVAVAQAKALNEFMAWGLTNEQLTDALKTKQAPRLVQMAKDIVKAIKQMIWGRKIAPKSADDFLSNLQFNSGIVIRSQPTISTINRDGELFHSNTYGTSDRLKQVRTAFGKKIIDYLGDEKFRQGEKLRQVAVSDAQMAAIDVALSMNAHGFPMTMQESASFRMIVTALATESEIDPNALARAQELYSHVSKNLKVESFMEDPESDDPSMRYYAQEKYDSVMGKFLTRTDAQGRTSLLPAFLGLATVSDEFRTVLAKLEVPQKDKNQEGTLDAMLENTANGVMDALSRRLAGDVSSKNVQQAVDNLIEHVKKVAQDEQTFIDQYSSKAGNISDRMNSYVVDGMEKLSDIVMEKATKVEDAAQNELVKAGARMTKLLASVVSEKNGAIVAEQTMVMVNKSGLWEPVQKLMADLVGRTQSNKLVYDMIKVTRSMVQQVRQQFREETPRIIMSKFKTQLTPEQHASMFHALGKTDLAVLRDTMSHADIQKLFSDQTALDNEINKLEQLIQANDPNHYGLIKLKMQQLAKFMNTGIPGKNLLRNAYSVANLYGQTVGRGYKTPPANIIKAIDKLTSLYAVENLSKTDRSTMASLVQGEAEGLSFTLDYLVGQRKEEMSKAAQGKARINAYKGFIPTEQEQGVALTVQDDRNFAELRQKGYVRVADYKGSSIERRKSSRGYYYAPLSGRAIFNQGIMQNVRHTAGGVDAVTGFTVNQMAGRISDRNEVRRIAGQLRNETNMEEALMPVYNDYGVVVALERPMSALQWQRVQPSQHLPRMIGVWRGRQAEEGMSQIYNEKLIDSLRAMYEEDMKISRSNQNQYINLLAPKSLNSVQQDAVNLFTDQTLEYIREKFGDQFWVRKDMLDDAIGYRSASVGDFWTGNSKWSKETQDTVKNLVAAFSLDGYKYLVKAEQVIQNLMADARTLIVVKSMVVPIFNFMSNVYQLAARGVPMLDIARSMPKKLGEIDTYAKTRLRQIDAEAELRATENAIEQRKLKAEIQSIEDSHKRLSIWPLIEAGEFSTIADVGMTSEDLELTSGKLLQYMEKKIDKLPQSARNAGRYALVTRDTALFQGLQKSVQYGDFIAKAVLYDDLVKRQKKTKEYALGRVTEEFVNYDRLPGRFRAYLENMGLLWFYNYKIRITKVAVSIIRNNPVHALMSSIVPMPIDGIDLPMGDNIVNKAIDGSLDWSMGPGMGLRAPTLNPWWNLVN